MVTGLLSNAAYDPRLAANVAIRLGESGYSAYTGIVRSGYLARWLFATAALFGISALAYAISLGRAGRRADRDVARPSR
jgi:hypothetical protein